MLTPYQVLPLLCHSDHDVRLHAAEFFADMADASPPETAAHLWQAIDRFGDVAGMLEIKERTSFLRILKEVPQDQASMARALELLKEGVSDENTERNLFKLFVALPLDFVNQHREEILPAVDDETAVQIEHRLKLQSMTGEQIWDQLLKLGDQAEAAKSFSEVDFETASRLVEALATHPELAIPQAEEVLAGSDERYWLETWCIELLGKVRHSPSIDQIIEKMRSDQGAFMHPVAATALGRMDPPLTVPKLLAGYGSDVIDGDDAIYFRMRFTEALGKMKDPLAEAALIQLLEKETDPELTSSICAALVDVCTTDGVEQLRQVVIEERYDENLADIKEELLTLSKMVGFNPPELQQWEQELKNPKRAEQRRSSMLDKMGLSKETFDMMQQYLGGGSSPAASHAPPEQSHSYQPVRPFRREEPKIGRNDPCPCGSGKKFKKCCGK